MKEEGLLVEEQLPSTGRFRRGRALRVDKSHIPSSDTGSDGSPLGDPEASGEEDMPDAKNEGWSAPLEPDRIRRQF
jgi:hypothetical protein